MNARQKIHQANLSKWGAIFQEQSTSQLSVKEWCAQNNTSIRAFYYWKRLLKYSFADSILPDIVPVTLSPTSTSSLNEPHLSNYFSNSHDLHNSYNSLKSPSEALTVSMGDIRIEIGSSANDEVIAAIIKEVHYA